MPIDQSQQEQLQRWLRERGAREACPSCGHTEMHFGDIVAPPAYPDGGGTAVGGPSFPLVQVICPNCAYVMQYAATHIGVSQQGREEMLRPGIGER